MLLMHMGWLSCDGVGQLWLCNLLFVLLSFEATKLFQERVNSETVTSHRKVDGPNTRLQADARWRCV